MLLGIGCWKTNKGLSLRKPTLDYESIRLKIT